MNFARLDRLPPYVFATVNQIKMDARRAGKDIIDLGMGNPDLGTPQHIVDAAKQALDEGYTRYPPAKGFEDLRVAIADKLKVKNKIIGDPDTEIFVSSGAMHAIFNSVLQIVEPGDEVIVIDPGFDYYFVAVLLAGSDRYGLSAEQPDL